MGVGIAEVPWVLRAIREKLLGKAPSCFLNWKDFRASGSGLFIWEAFVSGKAKKSNASTEGNGHVQDAQRAISSFQALGGHHQGY